MDASRQDVQGHGKAANKLWLPLTLLTYALGFAWARAQGVYDALYRYETYDSLSPGNSARMEGDGPDTIARSDRVNNDPPSQKVRKQPPQKTIDDFWDEFTTGHPGKILNILPKNVYAQSKAARMPKGKVIGRGALKSYEEAKSECEAAVQQIARECRRVNMRYRDAHFDIEFDLKIGNRHCLDNIRGYDISDGPRPRAVKRVPQIFKKPQFYVDEATTADVRQGKTGDCYLLAAVGALGNKHGLINRVCVARDEKVGVYGFVFFRDGEWIHTIIDDKLYLSIADYDESRVEKSNWTEIQNRLDAESEYREAFQSGSRALYFAQCNDENETWLPLLEKAYAKAHGDYFSIIGGFTGEAIEDLTGGVTTELFATDILDVDKFWEEELKLVNEQFLFGCATGRFDAWQDGYSTASRQGIVSTHAYTIMRAAEYKGERLVFVRNPWGQSEWTGRWSDGSEQWDAESMTTLGHKFGDDGMFWISFEDLLRKYQFFDRTRLFDPSWTVTQQWATADVPWSADYNNTKFSITLTKASPVVIVLSQLDDRYWTGLEGQYTFTLHFRLSKDGEDGYIVRSHGNYWMSRSVSTEVDLEPGTYSVLMKVQAERELRRERVEQVVRKNCKNNQEKLVQVALAYDLAHAKAAVVETEEDKPNKVEAEAKAKAAAKKKRLEKAKEEKRKQWLINKKQIERARREKFRKEEHQRKKKEAKKAKEEIEKEAKEAEENTVKPNAEAAEPSPAKATEGGVEIPKKETAKDQIEVMAATQEQASALETGKVEAPVTTTKTENAAKDSPGETTLPVRTAEVKAPGSDSPKSAKSSTEGEGEWIEKEDTSKGSSEEKAQTSDQERAQQSASAGTPALKVTTTDDTEAKADVPAAPGSEVKAAAPAEAPDSTPAAGAVAEQEDDDADTVISYVSSVDSDLDLSSDEEDNTANGQDADSDNEEFANDPWNAVCVVGLRVYSKEGEVTVAVQRPKVLPDEEETPLDVDDVSKGVSDEHTQGINEEERAEISEAVGTTGAEIDAPPAP